jgi:hypothetical protein
MRRPKYSKSVGFSEGACKFANSMELEANHKFTIQFLNLCLSALNSYYNILVNIAVRQIVLPSSNMLEYGYPVALN